MAKLRFISDPKTGRVEIRARRKTDGKFATLGYCHPATVALLRKDGLKPHLHLITMPKSC